jgi:sigma54-dependent transcription regulator
LLGLLFDPDGGDMFLGNIGCLAIDYMALYLRTVNCSKKRVMALND